VPAAGMPEPVRPDAPPLPAGPAADEVAWSFLKDTNDAGKLRRFIAQYPASPLRREAEARLKALKQTAVAVTLPVRPKQTAKPVRDTQGRHLFQGHYVCNYPNGWNGSGWYWCGYQFRQGLGWEPGAQ
jgi:hypothetical protein